MKSKGKCQQEDGEDGGHGQEGETDVVEEDDVLAHPRVEPDVEEEVEPGQGDRHCTKDRRVVPLVNLLGWLTVM